MVAKVKKSAEVHQEDKWPFGMKNYILFAVAMVVIIIGFVTLGQGSMTLAPVLLILGYCVLVPAALIVRDKKVVEKPAESEPGA